MKKTAEKLKVPSGADFRSFRTMHASLMRRMGGRLEVARDNMGHAGSTGSITLDVYSKSWWEGYPRAIRKARCLRKLLNRMVGERGFEPPTP